MIAENIFLKGWREGSEINNGAWNLNFPESNEALYLKGWETMKK